MGNQTKKMFPLKLDIQYFSDGDIDIKTIHTEFKDAWSGLKKLLDDQSDEIKKYGQANDKTVEEIKSMESRITQLGDDLKGIQTRADDLEKKMARGDLFGGKPEEHKSLGQKFIDSDPYNNMIADNSYTSAPLTVKNLFTDMEKKQLSTADGSAGAFMSTQNIPLEIPNNVGNTIRDLLPVQPTDSNSIEYVVESGFLNNASPVAELQLKPESSLSFDLETQAMKTIAHHIPISRQALADSNQLRAYIDSRLLYGLRLVETQQILYGDGLSPNLQGILTHPSIQTYDWSGGSIGDTKIDAIRRAITLARIAEYPVSGIVMHPNDWADIQLAKADNGQYIWANVNTGGQDMLWAVPVVETTAIAQGEALIGSFNMGAMLWDREQANIRVGEPNDYFTRNMVSILAEERIALTLFRPESFIAVTFDAEPTTTA